MSFIIKYLHESKFLLRKRDVPLHKLDGFYHPFKEKSHLKYCLELANYVLTEEQRDVLCETHDGKDPRQLLKMYNTIETQMLNKMWQFEGKDPEVEVKLQKKKSGQRNTGTYLGLGRRILKYKQLIHGRLESLGQHGVPKPPLIELRELSEVPKPGRPKGCRDVATYFPVVQQG